MTRFYDLDEAMRHLEQNAVSALAVSDRVYVLDLGRVVHKGPAAALLEDPSLRTRLLGF